MTRADETILSVHKSIDVLLLLQNEGREMGVTEIAKRLGMNKSTIHRILSTLDSRDFVQQNSETGKYWLGLRLYSLGMTIADKLPLKVIAAPYLKALSEKFNEGVHMAVLDRSFNLFPKILIIDKIQTQQLLSFTPPIGSGSTCNSSGMGKCLLAFCPDEYLRRYIGTPLPRLTKNTITEWPEFLQEMKHIREDGYAIDQEELEIGLTCVAGPILNRKQEIVAAISLSGPTSRINSDMLPDIIAEVKRTAKAISQLLQ
ncbi:MAG: yagI [Firmicutes bacterium]|nr:yagI [Bacillota bacterium]